MASSEIVQVRMRQNTQDQLKHFEEKVNAPSRSDAIRRAVEISDLLVKEIANGGKIIVQSKNGKEKEILITGLSHD